LAQLLTRLEGIEIVQQSISSFTFLLYLLLLLLPLLLLLLLLTTHSLTDSTHQVFLGWSVIIYSAVFVFSWNFYAA
jgi:hypothetical protein